MNVPSLHAAYIVLNATIGALNKFVRSARLVGDVIARRSVMVVFSLAVFLAACGGSSTESEQVFSANPGATPPPIPTAQPTVTASPTVAPTPPPATPTPPPATPTPTPTPAAPASLAMLQADIFGPNCAGCHGGNNPSGPGLALDTVANSFNNLVGVQSIGAPGRIRVIANDAGNSYLIDKLLGSPGIAGARMPRNAAPLTDQQIADVRSWIDAGALQMPTSASATRVVSTDVESTQAGMKFLLHASRIIDPLSISEGAVLVYGYSGEDKQLLAAELVAVKASGSTLEVLVNGTLVDFDRLELEINNPALSGVMDDQGRLLDGDGDERDGGAYIYRTSIK